MTSLRRSTTVCVLASVLPVLAPAQTPAAEDEPITLSAFVVDSTTDRGYVATNVVSASRIPLPLRDLPLAASVLTEEFLTDFGTVDSNDALRYATGMRKAFETETAYFLRGQRINYQLRNGFVRWDFTPTVNIQRVEVIKGPAAILYGLSFPGGVVNYITKKPLARDFANIGFETGSWDFLRGTLDFNKQLLPGGKLIARIVASKQEGGSYIKDDPNLMETISPSVLWKPFEGTTVTFEYDYAFRRDNQWPFGRPQISNNVVGGATGQRYPTSIIPADASVGSNSFKDQYSRALAVEIEQRLGANFTGRFVYNYSWREETELKRGLVAAQQGTLLSRWGVYGNKFRNWDEQYQLEVIGQLETGPIKHRLLVGAQYFDRTNDRRQTGLRPEFDTAYSILDIPPLPSTDFFNETFYNPVAYTGSGSNELPGYYLVDTLSMLEDRLFVLAGVRYTEIKQGNPRAGTTELTQDRTSPQIGASFRLLPSVSLFALRSESLQPNGQNNNPVGFGPQGAFTPQLGEGVDVGVKFELFDNKLSGTVTYFDVSRTNVPQNDPVLTAQYQNQTGLTGNVRSLSGEETTRGFEAEVVVSPVEHWQIVLGYQYVGFAEITSDSNPNRIGRPLNGVADTQLNLYTKYRFASGGLEGLSIGGGFTYISDFIQNPEFYPSTTQTDLFLQYETKFFGRNTRLSLNINNVFDEENQTSRGVVNPPFRIRGGVNVRF